MSGHEKFYIPHDDLLALKAAMESLETEIETLQARINILSSKMGTPTNLADLITGYSAEFDLRDAGQFLTITNFLEDYHRGLTFDGTYFYTFQANMEEIIRWSLTGTTKADFHDPHEDIAGLCWDTLNSQLITVEDRAGSATILTINAAGTEIDNQTVTYSDWADAHPLALCHDEQNDKFYIAVKSETENLVAIGEVSPSTGVISSAIELPIVPFHRIRDMEYINGVLSLLLSAEDHDKIIFLRVGESVPLAFLTSPAAPNENFCMDKTTKMWYFFSKYPADSEGDEIAYVKRRSLSFAPPRRIIDGGESITVDGAVTVTPSSTADLDTIEATLTNLEKATAAVDTDKLIVQREDASDNVAPAMDVAARKGFVQITDGTDVLTLLDRGDIWDTNTQCIPILGFRHVTGRAEYIPIVSNYETDIYKSVYMIPVMPMTGETQQGVQAHSNDYCFSINFGVDDIEAKTGFVLIDLSDATNYPHTLTTEMHVDWVSITIHGNTTSTGDLHVGFISAIDADKATMHAIASLQISKLESITAIHRLYAPSAIRCKLGTHLSGGTALHVDDVTFQNDTTLTATYGTTAPAVGDLVLLIDRTAGTFEHVHVAVGYHTL